MRTHGTLIRWNDDRGFGFVSTGGGEEVFAHVSAFPRDGLRPVVGELVSFEIQVGQDGKRKATKIQRAGTTRPAARRQDANGKDRKPASLTARVLLFVAPVVILAAIGVPVYEEWKRTREAGASPESIFSSDAADANRAGFTCDGRTKCSQMTSCAEAEYFLENCPETELDGNGDGEPCEQQWCN